MRPPSSKTLDKVSDEDLKKKKNRSKSSKRRRDPSISSSSYSESDLGSRSRRKKRSKSKKYRKESKKSRRRSGKKKRRYRREFSVSSFDSSCSDSERSRSPVRKSKSKRKERERSKLSESRRGGSRYRSTSCSTCSGDRSRSPSRGRSRSHSPVVERFGSSRKGLSPSAERFSEEKERFGSSRKWLSVSVERFGVEREKRRLRSVLAVAKASDEDGDKIIKAYDDYPSSKSNERYDEGDKKMNLVVEDKEKGSYDDAQHVKESSNVGSAGPFIGESRSAAKKATDVVEGDGEKEAEDMELILRQKALENFRKFRAVHTVSKESHETSKVVSQGSVKTPESKGSLDGNRQVHSGGNPTDFKARFFGNIPNVKNDGSKVHDVSIDSEVPRPVSRSITNLNTPNTLNRAQESSYKMPVKEASLAKDNQRIGVAVAQPNTNKVSNNDIEAAVRPTSGDLSTDNQISKSNEPGIGSVSGSQFEQKTFSRMHDGEVVQVSYKVYIPKKTPALARRQLQR